MQSISWAESADSSTINYIQTGEGGELGRLILSSLLRLCWILCFLITCQYIIWDVSWEELFSLNTTVQQGYATWRYLLCDGRKKHLLFHSVLCCLLCCVKPFTAVIWVKLCILLHCMGASKKSAWRQRKQSRGATSVARTWFKHSLLTKQFQYVSSSGYKISLLRYEMLVIWHSTYSKTSAAKKTSQCHFTWIIIAES